MMRCLLLLLLLALGGYAHAQNPEKGKEINSTCAGCHGELGQVDLAGSTRAWRDKAPSTSNRNSRRSAPARA